MQFSRSKLHELIEKTVLYSVGNKGSRSRFYDIYEGKLLDVTKDGNYVKIENVTFNSTSWESIDRVHIKSVLS